MSEKRKLLVNRIQTPDGTILNSYHTHDYKTHIDKNGLEYAIDGGNEYQRVIVHEQEPHIDLSIYLDSPFEEIREHFCRGGRGKDGMQPLTWIPLKQMSNDWLTSCIDYNNKKDLGEGYANKLYNQELEYRKENNIFIND